MEPLDFDIIKTPFCPSDLDASPLKTLDHLTGVRMREHLQFASESGLRDAFEGLTGEDDVGMEEMATKLAMAMEKVQCYQNGLELKISGKE